MSKKYEELAKLIADKVGGSENVSTLAHCQTRLRLVLHDNKKADKEGIKNLEGVANVIESGGQFQIVIGTHVEEVYEEVIKYLTPDLDQEPVTEDKRNAFNKLIDFISATFSPVIPAISGAGMVMAVLALLVLFDIVSTESQTYYVISFMADAVFYFLPVFLAYTAATKLKCSPFLAVALAGILLHPDLVQLVDEGEAVTVFGMPMGLATYSTSVIPILLIVFAQKYIEGFAKRISPNSVKIILVPLITIFVTGLIGLLFLGPIGSYAGGYLADGFEAMQNYGPWIPATLIGALLPLMVMFGLHHSVAPLGFMQLAAFGYEGIFGPGAIVSNIGLGVAVLIVSIRTRNKTEKQLATANGITGLMGITEPALYGIALPKKYPLIAAIIGGGIGGFYAGITSTIRFGTGSSGLPAIPLYVGEDIANVINIVIALVISAVISGILTYILSLRFEKVTLDNVEPEGKELTLKNTTLFNPIHGKVSSLSEVNDEAFSSESLGKGFVIEPSEGRVVAPFDGKIATVFPSKHAIGIVSNDGVEVLIHVGLNTVELNGRYFNSFVEAEQPVKKGQLLLTFELENIKAEGYLTQVPVVITNTPQYSNVELLNQGNSNIDEPVLKVEV